MTVRIIGIDPGSRITGYGVVDLRSGGRPAYVASGCIRCAAGTMAERLDTIFTDLGCLLAEHQPQEAALERVFVARSADSALKLGQARGVAIVALARAGLAVAEYAPRAIKQAVSGSGSADKAQVQQMVRMLLELPATPPADAADALAVAICHGHQRAALAARAQP